MLNENCLCWNVRGLNSRARRNVVRELFFSNAQENMVVVHELVGQENISLLSLQETKLDVCSDALIMETCGADFDYFAKPAANSRGGILLAWRRHAWSVACPLIWSYSLTAKAALLQGDKTWWITCVYGPQTDQEKLLFLDELREVRAACPGPWLICGDFNLIYQAEDKNNHRLNRRMMNCFRHFIDELELQELHLKGRLYTWSNERDHPTLERLDRVFVSDDWTTDFPDHDLSALASECSDHAPLLLRTDCVLPHLKRFHFENY